MKLNVQHLCCPAEVYMFKWCDHVNPSWHVIGCQKPVGAGSVYCIDSRHSNVFYMNTLLCQAL